jgi:hypothetical protein
MSGIRFKPPGTKRRFQRNTLAWDVQDPNRCSWDVPRAFELAQTSGSLVIGPASGTMPEIGARMNPQPFTVVHYRIPA